MGSVKIRIARADGMPGFAAYLAGTVHEKGNTSIDLEPNQALVLIDVEATFDDNCLCDEDGNDLKRSADDKKRQLIESLMHEFGHVLEDFFDTEFEEDWIEQVSASYNSNK